MESELHSESGDLNLATCLVVNGEHSNMWQGGEVLGRGRRSTPICTSPESQGGTTCQGNADALSLLFNYPALPEAKQRCSEECMS